MKRLIGIYYQGILAFFMKVVNYSLEYIIRLLKTFNN